MTGITVKVGGPGHGGVLDPLAKLTLQDSTGGALRNVEAVYLTCAEYQRTLLKEMTVELGSTLKPHMARECAHAMSLLKRASENPMLPLECGLSVVTPPGKVGTFATLTDLVVACPPCPDMSASHPLSVIPFVIPANRIGISIGTACCQTLVALHRLHRSGSIKWGASCQDLAAALVGVLVNAARLARVHDTARYLTSTPWRRYIDGMHECMGDKFSALKSLSKYTDMGDLVASLSKSVPRLYGLVFGRIAKHMETGTIPEPRVKDASHTVVVLTEQTNLFDLLPVIRPDSRVVILYSPLTLTTRLLLEWVVDNYLGNTGFKIEYRFHPVLLPMLAELSLKCTLDELLKKDGGPVQVVAGGNIINYLVGRKLEAKFEKESDGEGKGQGKVRLVSSLWPSRPT